MCSEIFEQFNKKSYNIEFSQNNYLLEDLLHMVQIYVERDMISKLRLHKKVNNNAPIPEVIHNYPAVC